MKRFLIFLLVAIFPMAAHASTDLAQQWGSEASRLSAETATLIHALDMGQATEISETYALDVYRFGRTSADLAQWIDGSDGPNDLGCIFRGMAGESVTQLERLDSDPAMHDRRASLQRLAGMFADAEIISLAAQRRSPVAKRDTPSNTQTCNAAPQRATMLNLR
jgi:hypothetical protein